MTGDTHTQMQTNPFRAEEATVYFTYDYLLYITYVTSTFVTKYIIIVTIITLRTCLSVTIS